MLVARLLVFNWWYDWIQQVPAMRSMLLQKLVLLKFMVSCTSILSYQGQRWKISQKSWSRSCCLDTITRRALGLIRLNNFRLRTSWLGGYYSYSWKSPLSPLFDIEMRRNLENIGRGWGTSLFFRKGDVMKVVEWWQKRKRKETEKLPHCTS